DWIYYANASNWTTVKAQLKADYKDSCDITNTCLGGSYSATSAEAEAYINAGYEVAIPVSSDLGPGEDWFRTQTTGSQMFRKGRERGGFIIAYKPDMSEIAYTIMRMGSALKGGGGSTTINTDPTKLFSPDQNFLEQQYKARQKFYSVDLGTGALTYTPPPSMVSGRGSFPYSLSYQAVWHSGKGWTNSFVSGMQVNGNGNSAMGGAGSLSAAETIAMIEAQLYLTPATQSTDLAKLKNHIVAALINMWWAERVAVNSATVTADNTERTFTRLADNTFYTPGDPTILSGSYTRDFGPDASTGGGVGGWTEMPISVAPVNQSFTATDPTHYVFHIRKADPRGCTGLTYRFTLTDKDHALSNYDFLCSSGTAEASVGYHRTSITFPYGMSVNYSYGTFGNTVSQVQNSLGRILTYDGGGTVKDTTDAAHIRTATGNLTICGDSDDHDPNVNTYVCQVYGSSEYVTDATNHQTTFNFTGIDLTKVFLPSDSVNPKFTFTYTGNDFVKTVTDALSNTWNFHIAWGRRGEIQDPLGNLASTLYDDRNHKIADIDGLNNVTSYSNYDGLNRLGRKTNPEGDYEDYTYDANSNLA